MGEIFKALQKLEVELCSVRQQLKLWIRDCKRVPKRHFLNVLSNVFLLHSLGEGNFKVKGDGQYFTSECNDSSIALASYNFTFTSLNFDESHKLH